MGNTTITVWIRHKDALAAARALTAASTTYDFAHQVFSEYLNKITATYGLSDRVSVDKFTREIASLEPNAWVLLGKKRFKRDADLLMFRMEYGDSLKMELVDSYYDHLGVR